jgi:hypothetical protein
MKYSIIILFIFTQLGIQAQKQNLYKKIVTFQEKGNLNIDPFFFDGIWSSKGGSTCGLKFKSSKNEIKLEFDNNKSYSFTQLANLKHNSILGHHYNWPPSYCFITVIDSKTIEVEFYTASESFTPKKRYVKK